jgi:transposase
LAREVAAFETAEREHYNRTISDMLLELVRSVALSIQPNRPVELAVDTEGLLMQAVVHSAGVQDRDGGVLLMATLFGLYPFLLKLYADGGYQGPKFQQGLARVCRAVNVEIVRRCDDGKFVVLPKRWIVERTIAWLNRCRRLAKDWECFNSNALAFLRWASVRLMLRRLCQS